MNDLLSPGLHRAAGVADDASLVAAMLRVEVAWLRALAGVGAVEPEDAEAVARAAETWQVDLVELGSATEDAGNPVVPLVAGLRVVVGDSHASLVHRGLTSQDVLDTALVLLSRDALARTRGDLLAVAHVLAALADQHRASVMVGRTLTQHAVPVTFGLKAAQWLSGVLDALDRVDHALDRLPVQCGGAAGTLSLVAETTDPAAAAAAFAEELGLRWPGVPWHTNRAPVTAVGDALVATTDALGVIASNIALLARPEIGELREGHVAGRGGSSTMPHKQNPVLAVLVRAASLQTPQLLAQLHLAAAQAVDERPDGAWHSEWPSLRRLLEVTVAAASQTAELVSLLEVDTAVMKARVEAASEELLAESGKATAAKDYLGAASRFIDTVLERLPSEGNGHA
jgi:3-carboxy-cis,cis-muconate cycloisomerase